MREYFHIGSDEGPAGVEIQEKKNLTLTHAGGDLNDTWWFNDLGLIPGSTLKAVLREEIKPSLFVHSAFNGKTTPLFDKIPFKTMVVSEFRGLVSRKVGLPVGAFRLLNSDGKEMFDCNLVDEYGVELGSTVNMETWDGWNEFLNLCYLGFATQVMQHLSPIEQVARYQMKVAMYIAAHYNHTDLAVSMQRNGIRADEAIGEHPNKMWCRQSRQHIDHLKTCVHEAAESGSLGVLRSFIHNNVVNVLAKDGNGLTPLNIALRKKQKPCASFLLTKQWSKISYTKKHSIPLSIYCKIRRWGDRAKDKTFVIHGQWKSSLKNPRRFIQNGALVGMNMLLDGYARSQMSSLSEQQARAIEEEEKKKKEKVFDFSDDLKPEIEPEHYFKQIQSISKNPRLNKFGKNMAKTAAKSYEQQQQLLREQQMQKESDTDGENETDTETGYQSPDLKRKNQDYDNGQTRVRFPPLTEKAQSVANFNQYGNRDESEFSDKKGKHGKALSIKTAPTPSRLLPSLSSRSLIGIPEDEKNKSKETQGKGNDEQATPRKRKSARSLKSAVMVAKARNESSSIPLPVFSWDTNPRPFVNPKNTEIGDTLKLYERMRGISSRNYAIQCLTVASKFKEKPWLAQVQQAMNIAAKGVKKTVKNKPHLFLTPRSETEETRMGDLTPSDSQTSSRTFMTA